MVQGEEFPQPSPIREPVNKFPLKLLIEKAAKDIADSNVPLPELLHEKMAAHQEFVQVVIDNMNETLDDKEKRLVGETALVTYMVMTAYTADNIQLAEIEQKPESPTLSAMIAEEQDEIQAEDRSNDSNNIFKDILYYTGEHPEIAEYITGQMRKSVHADEAHWIGEPALIIYNVLQRLTRPHFEATLSTEQQLQSLYPEEFNHYLKYLLAFSESPVGDMADAARMCNYLINHPHKLDQNLIRSLQERISAAEYRTNPDITLARSVVRKFFRNHPLRIAAERLDGDIVLFGSLEFGDNYHTDADILVAVQSRDEKQELQPLLEQAEKDLEKEWLTTEFGRRHQKPPHISILVLDDAYVELMDRAKSLDAEFFALEVFKLAATITGVPLYPETRTWFERIQKEAWRIAESDPLIAAAVNLELDECLNVRLKRE